MLYAFDLVHTNPSDTSDLGLGFNRGIVDNDRGRRGDHFMVDALSDAVASLGLDNALAGLLGFHGEVNDAHKRLFPHDSASASSQHSAAHHAAASLLKDGNNVLDKLTEQHLRDLLNSEVSGTGGGTTAEEYLAARAAAKAAAAAPSASPSGSTSSDSSSSSSSSSSQSTKAAKTKRRKQRQQQMEGGGEYTREDNYNYRPTNSGGGYFSGAGQDGDGAGDIFYDDDVRANPVCE